MFRVISLLLVLTAVVVSAETVSPDSGTVVTQVGLVDPFTLQQTPVTVQLQQTSASQASPILVSTQDIDYHGTTSLFEWVRPNSNGSESILVSDGSGDWDWYRPIIVPGRPDHRSPFTPDAEY